MEKERYKNFFLNSCNQVLAFCQDKMQTVIVPTVLILH